MEFKAKQLIGLLVVGAMTMAAPAALAQAAGKPEKTDKPAAAQPPKEHKDHADHKEKKSDKKGELAIGAAAPDFTLPDTDGKEHKLSSLQGKIVVIEWFNPGCPMVKKYHESNKTVAEMFKKYNAQGVEFVAINSGAKGNEGSGKDANAKAKTDWSIAYPILLDEAGAVGKTYESKNTPTFYIVDKTGKLAYWGSLDDDSSMSKVGKTNYVANALDELLAGKPVTTAKTKPFGCSVKYKD